MNRREVERVEWCFIHMPILLIDLEKSKHIHICSLSFSHRVFLESAGPQISWNQRRGNSWNGQATSLNPCTQLTSHVSCCSATLLVATKNLVHCKWAHSLEKLHVLPNLSWDLNIFFQKVTTVLTHLQSWNHYTRRRRNECSELRIRKKRHYSMLMSRMSSSVMSFIMSHAPHGSSVTGPPDKKAPDVAQR